VAGVRNVGTGRALVYTSRVPVLDTLFGTDGPGELLIDVPESELDPVATVVAVEFDRLE
jgi:hypothetical protein